MRDATEFDDFYAGSSRRVLGQVYAMVGNRAEAEDAVAEAYLKAWHRWHTVRECDNPEAWVRRVAYRVAVSAWRKATNRLRAHHREASADLVEAVGPDHVAIVQALRQISADQRRVIVLHHLVGLGVAEIAAEIGTSANTVKTWLARGRRALAEHLTGDEQFVMGGGGHDA